MKILSAIELMEMTPHQMELLHVPPQWRGRIKSYGDLLDRIKYQTVEDGTEWLVLNLPHEYAIEAGRIDTEIKLLWWIDHLCEKSWITSDALGVLIERVAERNGFERGAER